MTCEAARDLVDKTALSLLETSLQAHRFAREYLAEIDRVMPALTAKELNVWQLYARGAEEAARHHREALDDLKEHVTMHRGITGQDGAPPGFRLSGREPREAPEASA